MQQRHRRFHARLWAVLAILLPAILFVGMAIRQVGPVEGAAVKLKAPSDEATGTQ